jgi:hypothetical protein
VALPREPHSVLTAAPALETARQLKEFAQRLTQQDRDAINDYWTEFFADGPGNPEVEIPPTLPASQLEETFMGTQGVDDLKDWSLEGLLSLLGVKNGSWSLAGMTTVLPRAGWSAFCEKWPNIEERKSAIRNAQKLSEETLSINEEFCVSRLRWVQLVGITKILMLLLSPPENGQSARRCVLLADAVGMGKTVQTIAVGCQLSTYYRMEQLGTPPVPLFGKFANNEQVHGYLSEMSTAHVKGQSGRLHGSTTIRPLAKLIVTTTAMVSAWHKEISMWTAERCVVVTYTGGSGRHHNFFHPNPAAGGKCSGWSTHEEDFILDVWVIATYSVESFIHM